jgi:hypothetical protein
MSERALEQRKRKTNSEYAAAAQRLLTEMEAVEQQMDRHRAEGERLKAETQVIKERVAVTLARLRTEIERLTCAASSNSAAR